MSLHLVFNKDERQELKRMLRYAKANARDEEHGTPGYSDPDERHGRPEPRNPYLYERYGRPELRNQYREETE